MSAPGFTQAATGFGYRDGVLCAEDVPLPQIAATYGSPCYVYSRAALEAAYAGYVRALAGRNALICYAVKANSNLAILNLFARLGAGFDLSLIHISEPTRPY